MNPILFCIYLISGLMGVFIMFGGVHKIYEGHIGVYTRGGALLKSYTEPGVHFMIPFITKYHSVQVTVQTDKVTNIPCGTSGGVVIEFGRLCECFVKWLERIEVVNRLKKEYAYQTVKDYTIDYDRTWIFDKIHHEINQFCSAHTLQEVYIDLFDMLDDSLKAALQTGCDKWAPGIEIIAVRVTKPKIPAAILENYEKMEREKTKLLIAKESRKVREKETETERVLEKIRAETASAVAEITMQEQILLKEGNQAIQTITNQINSDRQKTLAEGANYKRLKEIEINQKKLTKELVFYNSALAIKSAQKFYFGKSLPEYILQNKRLTFYEPTKKSEDHPKESKKSKQLEHDTH